MGSIKKARRIRDFAHAIQTFHQREGLSIAEIATHYGCHPETIRRIVKDILPKEKSIH